MDLRRLSFNQATLEPLGLDDVIRACSEADIPAVGVWRHKLSRNGLAASAKALKYAGLSVSSLCRAGMFPYADEADRLRRRDDNFRALDEAATLGAHVLVLVCGPPIGHDLRGARQQICEGVAELASRSESMGIMLGVEPLHPMMIGERSAIVTLHEALAIVEEVGSPSLGIVVDAYHVWWDPCLDDDLRRAQGLVVGFHVSDWLVPTTSVLRGRGMMGTGIIPLRSVSDQVTSGGYKGAVEVEILNEEIWCREPARLLREIKERFVDYV